jgi:hypothetical protein
VAKTVTTEGLSDEYIQERACAQPGCVNWAEQGVIYCVTHVHGAPRPMPEAIAKRKLELEKS